MSSVKFNTTTMNDLTMNAAATGAKSTKSIKTKVIGHRSTSFTTAQHSRASSSPGSGALSELTGVTEDHQTAVFDPKNQRDWISSWGWKNGKWSALGKGGCKYRWFVLENTRLAYWKSDVAREGIAPGAAALGEGAANGEGKTRGNGTSGNNRTNGIMGDQRNEIQLMSIEALQTCYVVHASSRKNGRYGIHLRTADRMYTMMLETITLRDQWMTALLEALARLGHPLLLSRISQQYDKTNVHRKPAPQLAQQDSSSKNKKHNNSIKEEDAKGAKNERDEEHKEHEEDEEDDGRGGVGYGSRFSDVDDVLSLKEVMRIKHTDKYYNIEQLKRIPICPSFVPDMETRLKARVSKQEEAKTLHVLKKQCLDMYSEVKHLLHVSETIHSKVDEIGKPFWHWSLKCIDIYVCM